MSETQHLRKDPIYSIIVQRVTQVWIRLYILNFVNKVSEDIESLKPPWLGKTCSSLDQLIRCSLLLYKLYKSFLALKQTSISKHVYLFHSLSLGTSLTTSFSCWPKVAKAVDSSVPSILRPWVRIPFEDTTYALLCEEKKTKKIG